MPMNCSIRKANGIWIVLPADLYYKPLANENISTATVVAPVLETLVNAAGTYATPLHNVQFYGITFAYATWLRTSTGEGYIPGQSGELK